MKPDSRLCWFELPEGPPNGGPSLSLDLEGRTRTDIRDEGQSPALPL